jgi:hypothetical protein
MEVRLPAFHEQTGVIASTGLSTKPGQVQFTAKELTIGVEGYFEARPSRCIELLNIAALRACQRSGSSDPLFDELAGVQSNGLRREAWIFSWINAVPKTFSALI